MLGVNVRSQRQSPVTISEFNMISRLLRRTTTSMVIGTRKVISELQRGKTLNKSWNWEINLSLDLGQKLGTTLKNELIYEILNYDYGFLLV